MRPAPVMAMVLTAGVTLAAGQSFAACSLGKMAELPVTMSNMRPMVKVKINGEDANFIADSGAFFSVITPGSAAEHHLRLGPAPWGLTIVGVGGRVEQLSLATVKTFSIADVNVPNVEFIVGGSEVGNDAAGVIGQNVLGIADVEYDLANGAIRLFRPINCSAAQNVAYWIGTSPYSVMDINWTTPQSPHTTGTAYVNGTRIKVLFDTGAATSFITLKAAERAGVTPKTPGVAPSGSSTGVGRNAVKTWVGPFASFKIGDEEIQNTRLRIGDTDLEGSDMLIGADFFLSHRIYVAKSQHKLYFTYNGGAVFNLTSAPPLAVAAANADHQPDPSGSEVNAPTDAEGFSRRGQAFAARRDYEHALQDLDRACDLAPSNGQYVYQRAQVRLANRQPFLAMADLDQALKLTPDDVTALLLRSELRLAGHDKTEAVVDLKTADRLAPKQSDLRLRLAADFERAALYAPALEQFDLWIATHPDDSKGGDALRGRCWSRAQLGQDLGKALSDCDGSLRLAPKNPATLSDRGLVRLRLGDLDKALADYDAALTLQPKNPWALYGRGVVKMKKGQAVEGQADIAAAKALQPLLPDEAAQRGISP